MSEPLAQAIARFTASAVHPGARDFALAVSLRCAGHPAEAATAFQASLADPGPHQLRAVYGLGLCWAAMGQREAAELAFRRLLEHTDALLAPAIELGLLLIRQGRYVEALDVHEAALLRHPQHPDLARIIADAATVYDALGLYAEGVALCRRALDELGINEPLIWRNLGVLHLRLGETAPARAALRAAAAAPWLRDELAALWAEWGDGGPL